MRTKSIRKSSFFRFTSFIVLTAFVGLLPAQPGYSQVSIVMTPPGQMLHVTQHFEPPQMVGLKMDLKNPFSFGFIMDQGENPMPYEVKKEEFSKIINYFLVSLAMPNKDMWVNLSPYESKRIIPEVFGQTEMGRDLLAQDYMLKQFTASLMYPENGLGKEFWNKVYAQAQARFGTTDINVNTFNKVWIVADHADVYQKGDTAFLVGSHLKVMLEQDYMAIEKNKEQFGDVTAVNDDSTDAKTQMASQLVREIIIPAIEKEVNEGQSFAAVRQIYNAEIMATWFKKTLQASLLGQVFADKSKIAGQMVSDPQAKQKIFLQYLRAYKRGVFDYIKREATPDGQIVPRRYLSGGAEYVNPAIVTTITPEQMASSNPEENDRAMVLANQLRQVQMQNGPEAVQGEIAEVITRNNTFVTPKMMLDTLANTPNMNGGSREQALGLIADHITPIEATDVQKSQIRDMVNQLGAPQEENVSPAVTARLNAQKVQIAAELAAAAPSYVQALPAPTQEAMLNVMNLDTAARLLTTLQSNAPAAEVSSFVNQELPNVASNRDELVNASFVEPNSGVGQQQASVSTIIQPEETTFAQALNQMASQPNTPTPSIGEMFAQIANPPTAVPAELQQRAQNYTNQISHIQPAINPEAARGFFEEFTTTPSIAVTMASPSAMAGLLSAVASNQAYSAASANMIGEMMARMANPPTINATALQDQARSYADQYRNIQPATNPVAARSFFENFTSTPSVAATMASPRAMAEVLSAVASNQAYSAASTNMLGEMMARMANHPNLARNFEEQYQARLTSNPAVAPVWAARQFITQLNQRAPGLISSMREIQEALPVEIERQTQALKTYMPVFNANADLRAMVGQNNVHGVEAFVEPRIASGEIEGNINEAVRGIMSLGSLQNEAVSRVADRLRSELPKEMVNPMINMERPLAQEMVQRAFNEVEKKTVGGINLSDEHLTMNIKVDGAGMPLPPQYQDPAMMNLNGLVSIIRSITPITQQNVPALYELTK